jgi:adenylate cyclase
MKIRFSPKMNIRQVSPLKVGLIATIFLFTLSFFDIFEFNDFGSKKSLDFLSQTFPYDQYYRDNSAGLILIAIDDDALNQLGQWPWPRQVIAKIINNVKKSGVAAIGVDVLFLEEDRYSPHQLARNLHIPINILQNLGFESGDIKLDEVLSQSPAVIAFSLGKNQKSAALVEHSRLQNLFVSSNDVSEQLLSSSSLTLPQKTIKSAPGFGFVNANEQDGLIRENLIIANHQGQLIPSLSMEMLRVAQGARNYVIKLTDSGHGLLIKVGDFIVQANLKGQLLYHHGSTQRFRQISASRFLDGPVAGLDNHLAIFGVNALALGDRHATINEDSIPGALLHLQTLDQILSERYITSSLGFDRMIFLLCALIAIMVCYSIVRVPLLYSIMIVSASFSILVGISAFSFIKFGFVFNFLTSSLILISGGFITYVLQSFYEERLRKKLQNSFAQYVPSDVVKRISKSDLAPKLGGELIEASVLFLDLRGFTALTEKLKPHPELMVKVIGTIMNEVTARLIESGATIDKYIGDAVMAFWNAPEKQDNHTIRAIYGACRIQEDLEIIRSQIYNLDPITHEIKIAFGIGICSGPITVGNFGSEFRFNYTALGDAVNTASRLESLTKEKGQPILIVSDNLMDGQILEFNNRTIQINLVGSTEIRGKVEVLNIFTAKFVN